MIITTDRLTLRPITISDAGDVYEYAKGKQVGPNAGWKPHERIEESKEIIQQIFLDKENIFGIVLKNSGKLIGSVGLIEDPKREYDRVKMLGYALGEAHWGNGFMTEAAEAVLTYGFRTLELELISAYCYPFNQRSQKVLEKLGFLYEGTLSLSEKLYNGKVYDHMCFALPAK